MNVKRMMALAAAAIFTMTLAGEAMARGGNGGNGAGNMNRIHSPTQTNAASSSAVRPVDSRRRDGTFLNSGTTANGSTTRPANGNGLQDGSGMATPVPVPVTAN